MNPLLRVAMRATGLASTAALSKKAPAGALVQQGSWTAPDQALLPEWDAQSAINDGYLAEMYVYRCVQLICRSISMLPFRAGMDPTQQAKFSQSSKLAQLLGPAPGGPAPAWSARKLWHYSIAQYLLTGKMAWLKERAGGPTSEIIGLWPLQVQYLNPVPNTTPGGGYFKRFEYGQRGTRSYTEFDPSQVVYIYRPSLKDVRQPESVLQAAQLNINVLKMINRYDFAFLRNNAVPSTIIVTEPFAEPEERRAFRDQFVSEFTGYGNAGKTLFVEAGDEDGNAPANGVNSSLEVQRLGLTAREAQMDAQRDAKISDICVALGVPLSCLGDARLAKFQNADQDERNLWLHNLIPTAVELADEVNLQLAPELGPDLGWFDTRNVGAIQRDKTFKPADPLPLVMANLITRDEAREEMGLAAWSEVDPTNQPVIVPAVAAGISPNATPGTSVELMVEKAAEPDPEPPTVVMAPPVPPALAPAEVPVKPRRRSSRHAGHEGHSPIPSGHANDPDKVRLAFEKMLQLGFTQLLADQRKSVEARARGRRGKQGGELFNAPFWADKTRAMLEPMHAAMSEFYDVPDGHTERSAQRITAATAANLDQAFDAGRAAELAAGEMRALDPVLADHLLKLLEAVSGGKLSADEALALL